jgi:hypothetical protein
MRFVRWSIVASYIALDAITNAPAYYIMAYIDLTGSSSGWHRSRLIESSIEHLSEWWLIGTDYTRHWMPTGVSWSPNQSDITNHFILLGTIGGLPLMFLFMATLAKAFGYIGQGLRQTSASSEESHFMLWTFGACLFAHAATCISVAYFDQSIVFLYLTLGAIGSVGARSRVVESASDIATTPCRARLRGSNDKRRSIGRVVMRPPTRRFRRFGHPAGCRPAKIKDGVA